MKDAGLHYLLGGAFASLCVLAFLWLPPAVAGALSGSLYLFLREVGQIQAKLYDNDFKRGWDFWHWSWQKGFETWAPIVLLNYSAYILTYA